MSEKQLILEHTSADPEYAGRLRRFGTDQVRGSFTLEDLDDLRGYVAAETNHTKNSKLEKALDALWGRLTEVMESYDDGGWG